MISNNRINANIKILTDGYLNSTYYDFYYPEEYIKADMDTYTRLPNGVYDGFCSIYDQNGNSKGKYNENDTLTLTDPYQINILKNNSNEVSDSLLMAP